MVDAAPFSELVILKKKSYSRMKIDTRVGYNKERIWKRQKERRKWSKSLEETSFKFIFFLRTLRSKGS